MKIAIEGCSHGELDVIYNTLEYIENREKIKIDLLLCCGDFEAVRDEEDLRCMAVPPKYRKMTSFVKYYNGEKIAPILTVFIGGNHEASNHLQELYYGGWVAPNIYYLGASGVVHFGGFRIAGLSGIYKHYSYKKGHHEKPPYNESDIRSVYHIREFEVFKLMQLSSPIHIFLSHDWPQGIVRYGNQEKLFRAKHFLREESENFGSPPATELLYKLQPDYWFAGHMHVKFPALVPHPDTGKTTKFLALSKVKRNEDFLQIIDIVEESGGPSSKVLSYDPEWLLILLLTKDLMSSSRGSVSLPSGQREEFMPRTQEINCLLERISGLKGLSIPKESFERKQSISGELNLQTSRFLQFLEGFRDCLQLRTVTSEIEISPRLCFPTNPEEIPIDIDLTSEIERTTVESADQNLNSVIRTSEDNERKIFIAVKDDGDVDSSSSGSSSSGGGSGSINENENKNNGQFREKEEDSGIYCVSSENQTNLSEGTTIPPNPEEILLEFDT